MKKKPFVLAIISHGGMLFFFGGRCVHRPDLYTTKGSTKTAMAVRPVTAASDLKNICRLS
jgi:hypothetical protein